MELATKSKNEPKESKTDSVAGPPSELHVTDTKESTSTVPLSSMKPKLDVSVQCHVDIHPEKNKKQPFPMFPHIICFYKETDEISRSLGTTFSKEYAPPIVAVCEHAALETEFREYLKIFFKPIEGENLDHKENVTVGLGLTKGKHKFSGADMFVYIKSEDETQGKRFSQAKGVDICSEELKENYDCFIFQDADSTASIETINKIKEHIVEKGFSLVGPSMVCKNYNPLSFFGSYTLAAEIYSVNQRRLDHLVTGNARVISGSFFALKKDLFDEVRDDYETLVKNDAVIKINALNTEDTRLSFMASLCKKKSIVLPDEAEWNLPDSLDTLLKQRKRWVAGEFCNSIDLLWALRKGNWRFFLWCLFSFINAFVFIHAHPFLTIYFVYKYFPEEELFLKILLGFQFVRLLYIVLFFRRDVSKWKVVIHIFLVFYLINFLGYLYLMYLFMRNSNPIWFWISGLGLVLTILPQALGSKTRMFVYFTSAIIGYTLPGLSLMLFDNFAANFSDVSWGVRESVQDRKRLKKSSSLSQTQLFVTSRKVILWHIFYIFLLVIILPSIAVFLSYCTNEYILIPNGLYIFVYYFLSVERFFLKFKRVSFKLFTNNYERDLYPYMFLKKNYLIKSCTTLVLI